MLSLPVVLAGRATCSWAISHTQLQDFGRPSSASALPNQDSAPKHAVTPAAKTLNPGSSNLVAGSKRSASAWVAGPAAHQALQQGAAALLKGHPQAALQHFQGAQEFAFLPCLLVRPALYSLGWLSLDRCTCLSSALSLQLPSVHIMRFAANECKVRAVQKLSATHNGKLPVAPVVCDMTWAVPSPLP